MFQQSNTSYSIRKVFCYIGIIAGVILIGMFLFLIFVSPLGFEMVLLAFLLGGAIIIFFSMTNISNQRFIISNKGIYPIDRSFKDYLNRRILFVPFEDINSYSIGYFEGDKGKRVDMDLIFKTNKSRYSIPISIISPSDFEKVITFLNSMIARESDESIEVL